MIRQGGAIERAAIAPRSVPFDVDLGRDDAGRLVAAYSRCDRDPDIAPSLGRGCDLYVYDLASRQERLLRGPSSEAASEYMPSLAAGRVAFARVHERRPGAAGVRTAVYVRGLDRGPARRLPGGTVNDDDRTGVSGLDLDARRLAIAWRTAGPAGQGIPYGTAELLVDRLDGGELTRISSHLRRARTELVRNPAYVVLGLRGLHVNEVVGAGDFLHPGEQVAYLAELEHGHATLSTRACWLDPSGIDNCGAQTLDGLLDPASMRPRGPWWVTRWYARGVASRVWARPSEGAVEVLASSRSPNPRRAEVLIGAYDPHDGSEPAARVVRVDLTGVGRLRFARGRARLGVVVFRMPSMGAAPARPQPADSVVVPVRGGAATVYVVVRPHRGAVEVGGAARIGVASCLSGAMDH